MHRTSAVELALLGGALSLIKVLVSHLGGHRDALSGGLGDVLGHPKSPRDDVTQERHIMYSSGTPCTRLSPLFTTRVRTYTSPLAGSHTQHSLTVSQTTRRAPLKSVCSSANSAAAAAVHGTAMKRTISPTPMLINPLFPPNDASLAPGKRPGLRRYTAEVGDRMARFDREGYKTNVSERWSRECSSSGSSRRG